MDTKELEIINQEIEVFKNEASEKIETQVQSQLEHYKNNLNNKLMPENFEIQVQEEVAKKMTQFKEDIDLKPKAIYYAMKTEVELDDNLEEKELIVKIYQFMEKHTKSKFLKKILKEMIKEKQNER